MSAARLRLVECRAILGGERDPLRTVWDEQATKKDRRMLLAMAGRRARHMAAWAACAWGDLAAEDRDAIRGALKRFRAWSERVA